MAKKIRNKTVLLISIEEKLQQPEAIILRIVLQEMNRSTSIGISNNPNTMGLVLQEAEFQLRWSCYWWPCYRLLTCLYSNQKLHNQATAYVSLKHTSEYIMHFCWSEVTWNAPRLWNSCDLEMRFTAGPHSKHTVLALLSLGKAPVVF